MENLKSQTNFFKKNETLKLCLIGLFLYLIFFGFNFIQHGDIGIFGHDALERFTAKFFMLNNVTGELSPPMWNPYSAGGMSYLENQSYCNFYLLHFPMLFLPLGAAESVIMLIHILMCIWAGFKLSTIFTKDTKLSFLAAIAISFCGILSTRHTHGHFHVFYTYTWFPVCTYFLLSYFKTKSFSKISLLALAMSMQFYAGFPQVTIYSFMIYGVIYLISMSKSQTWKKDFLFGILLLLMFVGLSAIVIFPMSELSAISDRKMGMTHKMLSEGSYHPYQIISLIFPYRLPSAGVFRGFAYPHESSFYFSIPLLIFAIGSLFKKQNKFNLVLLAFIAGILFLSFGRFNFISKLYNQFFPFNMFRIPSRIVTLLPVFCVGYVVLNIKDELSLKNLKKYSWVSTLLLFVYLWYLAVFYKYHSTFLNKNLEFVLVPGVILAFITLCTLIFYKKNCLPKKIIYYITALVFVDYIALNFMTSKVRPHLSESEVYKSEPVVKFLKQKLGEGHERVVSHDGRSPIGLGRFSPFQKISDLTGSVVPATKWMRYLYMAYHDVGLERRYSPWGVSGITYRSTDIDSTLFDLYNVKYHIIDQTKLKQKLDTVYEDKDYVVVENKNRFPFCMFIDTAIGEPDDKLVAKKILSKGYNPRNLVYLANSQSPKKSFSSLSTVRNISFTGDSYIINMNVKGSSRLYCSISYNPKWEVVRKDSKVIVDRANVGFISFEVESGDSEIEIRYSDATLKKSIAVSFISLFLVIAMALFFRKRPEAT
ncbi:MAG: hypothetical protein BM556_09015 [Bacteriovorax sp. MedPE-SWde]|nr:MAG: hypothetical protein BM556_09015 [Bacteriovorax sp. MedPE-SWde]